MKRFILIVLLALTVSIAFAKTERTIKRKDSGEVSGTGKRLALVIGNGNYTDMPLANPLNDAKDMSKALREMGFDVIEKINANNRTMKDAIQEFGQKLRGNEIGLFYFAGHGIQVKGQNYLIPVGVEINSESDVEYEGVEAGRVLGKMEDVGNSVNIVILDACRNNPFGRSFRSADKGLARMDAPTGSIIAYATAPGKTAADGTGGRNGVFTESLLKYMKTPGLTIQEVLMKTRLEVKKKTSDVQVPWEASSLTNNFYFASSGAVIEQPSSSPDTLENGIISVDCTNVKGADVIVDGEIIGKTPLTNAEISIGTHRIRVEKEGYISWQNQKTVEKGKMLSIKVILDSEKPSEPERPAQPSQPAASSKPNETGKEFTNSLGMKFVYIPPGTFMMGSPASEEDRSNDEVQHSVTLTKGFYMQTTEVTQGQWKAVIGNNPSYFQNCGDNCPVEQVSWEDAKSFIQKLNQKEGTNKYRLPTEAEWEYSARAGSQGARYGDLNGLGWYGDNSGETTHPTAQKQPNNFGLYDMLGNVYEWCNDWYGDYPSGSVSDPSGPSSGSSRVLRGGGWYPFAQYCRSANRSHYDPSYGSNGRGFRLACSVGQ